MIRTDSVDLGLVKTVTELSGVSQLRHGHGGEHSVALTAGKMILTQHCLTQRVQPALITAGGGYS